jgi:hypothetical protein
MGAYGLADPARDPIDLFRYGALWKQPDTTQPKGAVGMEEHPDRHSIREQTRNDPDAYKR